MKKYFFNVTIAIISNESAVVMYVFPEKFVGAVDGPQMHRWMPSDYRAFNFTLYIYFYRLQMRNLKPNIYKPILYMYLYSFFLYKMILKFLR